MNSNADRGKYALQITLLILVTITAFSNILSNRFVWDDNSLIPDNPHVKEIRKIPYLFTPHYWNYSHPGSKGGYRPVVMASLAIDYRIWRGDVMGFHITNIALHLANVILVFILMTLLTRGSRYGPWFCETPFVAALLFAVYPVHVESVTWIKNRGDPLSSIFFITAFILFIKCIPGKRSPIKTAALFGSLFCFLMALLSKEIAVTLPLVILSYCLYALPARERVSAAFKTLPFFVASALYAVFKLGFFTTETLLKGIEKIGLYSNALVVLKTFACYVGIMANPINLNAERRLPVPRSFLEPSVLLSFALLAAIIAVIIVMRKRARLFGFALIWILITLLPYSNIIALYPRPIAEQRLYLPSVGFCFALALIVNRLFRPSKIPMSRRMKALSALCVFSLAAFYSILTMERNLDWRDPVRFWTKTSMSAPYRSRTHYNLGCTLLNERRVLEAIESFKRAVFVNPKDDEAYYMLGNAYYIAKLYDESIMCLEKSIELNLKNLDARKDLNVLYQVTGRTDKAAAFYEKMLKMYPKDGSVCSNLAVIYEENLGRHKEAVGLYKRAIGLEFKVPVVYYNLGVAYDSLGMPKEALESYKNAVFLKPDFAEAYNNIAAVYYRQGRQDLAARYGAKAKKLKELNRGFSGWPKPDGEGHAE